MNPVVAARQYFTKRAQCYRGTRRVTKVSRWIRGNVHELPPAPSLARNESGHCRGRGAQLGPNLPIDLHHQDSPRPAGALTAPRGGAERLLLLTISLTI